VNKKFWPSIALRQDFSMVDLFPEMPVLASFFALFDQQVLPQVQSLPIDSLCFLKSFSTTKLASRQPCIFGGNS
jgi:hypothetical protein